MTDYDCEQVETPPLPEECEELYSTGMPFDNRFDGLDRRIGDLAKNVRDIELRLAQAPQAAIPQPESRLHRYYYTAGVATPIVAVFGLVGAFAFGLFNSFFESRISAKLNEPNGVTSQLSNISSQMGTLTKDLETANGTLKAIQTFWEEQLKKNAALTPKDFQKELPQVADNLKAASILKVKPSREVDKGIQQNFLASDSSAPSYWPAVAQFITYRSERTPVAERLQLLNNTLSPCKRTNPEIIDGPEPYAQISTCTVALEDRDAFNPSAIVRTFLLSSPRGIPVFRNCVVTYHGGQIRSPIIKAAVFKDCLFVIELNSPPPGGVRGLLISILKDPAKANMASHG